MTTYHILIESKRHAEAHRLMHPEYEHINHCMQELTLIDDMVMDTNTTGTEFKIWGIKPEQAASKLRKHLPNLQIMKRVGCWPFYYWTEI